MTWKRAERGVSKELRPGHERHCKTSVANDERSGPRLPKAPVSSPGCSKERAPLWARVQGEPVTRLPRKKRTAGGVRCPSEPGVELREQGQGEKQPPLASPFRDMSKRATRDPETLIAGQRHNADPPPQSQNSRHEFPEQGLATAQRLATRDQDGSQLVGSKIKLPGSL